MEVDYLEVRRLLQIRKKQIFDDSLVYSKSNLEYRKIEEMEKSIGDILISERGSQIDTPAIGDIAVGGIVKVADEVD